MGAGQSAELQATSQKLASAQRRTDDLARENSKLKAEISAGAAASEARQVELASSALQAAALLQAKDAALAEATKQRQLAEELRRSDALLAKRLLHAQLRHLGGEKLPSVGGGSLGGDGAEAGELAAQLALAAQDEMQLRQVLIHTATELEAAQHAAARLSRGAASRARSELAAELWVPRLCDASFTLRSAQLSVLAGLRMPRAAPGERGSGFSPALGVLRRFGGSAADGAWGALGGSLVWDARETKVEAMRLAACAQPSPGSRLGLAFDHTGLLSGSCTVAARESLTAKLHGSFDVNQKKAGRAGIELVYDLD